ncbi:MAG: hypothetical protein U1E74_09555 [Paenacidovorax caeni]
MADAAARAVARRWRSPSTMNWAKSTSRDVVAASPRGVAVSPGRTACTTSRPA